MRRTARSSPRELDDEVILLDRDREGFRDIGPLHQRRPRLDRYLERPRASRVRIAPGLAGADVELPAVPGAAQEFLLARQPAMAVPFGPHPRADQAAAAPAARSRA